jgi:xylose isomerase
MRAIDLGAELGASLHELSGEARESGAAKPPLDALDRFREAVDFLCAYAREQGYHARVVLRCGPGDGHDEVFLSTAGHALAFTGTLAHPEMVGLGPTVVHGTGVASGWHGVAQAIDARKLLHVRLDERPDDHVCDTFLLVKLLEESGYDGPLHFDVDPSCFDDAAELWDVTAGCMRTYRALAAKARRFADDPEIRDALAACGALELAEPTVGPYSAEAERALSTERFDPAELVQRRYRDQRLDQLVTDLVLGLR